MRTRELYWKSLDKFKNIAVVLDGKVKPFYCPLQQRHNQGVYAVNINARVGFFAQLNWCLYIFAHCERFHLKPVIRLTSPFYVRAQGQDWLGSFFENLRLTSMDKTVIENGSIKFSHISDIEQLGLPADYSLDMSLEDANRLFWSSLTLKNEIADYVEEFTDKHFDQRTMLGIHYRGTDKSSEANPVTRDYALATVLNYIEANPQVDALYVASDEASFIDWIKQALNGVEVISHDDTERSRDGKAIHTQPGVGDNYIKGREALINSLLLSKCSALIRSSSFLSAWSSIFNPGLPIIMLNRPFDSKLWFPDALLTQNSMNEYLPNKI